MCAECESRVVRCAQAGRVWWEGSVIEPDCDPMASFVAFVCFTQKWAQSLFEIYRKKKRRAGRTGDFIVASSIYMRSSLENDVFRNVVKVTWAFLGSDCRILCLNQHNQSHGPDEITWWQTLCFNSPKMWCDVSNRCRQRKRPRRLTLPIRCLSSSPFVPQSL